MAHPDHTFQQHLQSAEQLFSMEIDGELYDYVRPSRYKGESTFCAYCAFDAKSGSFCSRLMGTTKDLFPDRPSCGSAIFRKHIPIKVVPVSPQMELF